MARANKIPIDIPKSVSLVYKEEWKGWGDFLGTGYVANQLRKYRPFTEAKRFIRLLNLKSQNEWRKYIKSGIKPRDIPSAPSQIYKDQWKGFGDFLGTNRIADRNRKMLNYNDAKLVLKSLNIDSADKWRALSKSGKKPPNIPLNAQRTYKTKGWVSWGDFLGTGIIATPQKVFVSYDEAKKIVSVFEMSSIKQWQSFAKSDKKPKNIPHNPQMIYKGKGWKGFKDFLGKRSAFEKYLAYDVAKKYISSLGLKSKAKWEEYCANGLRPKNIPYNPLRTYRNHG